jgi:hypothetical protein
MKREKIKKSGGKKFLRVLLGIIALVVIVYSLQYFFHFLDVPLKYLNNYLAAANGIVFKEMAWGISVGTILFIGILIVLPILMRNINTRSYFKNLYNGILSSFIFFISQLIYKFCEKISKFYLLLSIAGVSLITLILIQIVAGMYKKKEEQIEFRTQYIASITAGLIFGILLQLVMMVMDAIKGGWHHFQWPDLHLF